MGILDVDLGASCDERTSDIAGFVVFTGTGNCG